MRYPSTSEILDFVRSHPDCVTADLLDEFYPESTTVPCDRTSGQYNINTKLDGLRRRKWIINANPGHGHRAVWRAVA